MKKRLAVARVLAREILGKCGQPATEEAIERKAAIIAKGLYIERAQDEIALTVHALIGSWAEPSTDERGGKPPPMSSTR